MAEREPDVLRAQTVVDFDAESRAKQAEVEAAIEDALEKTAPTEASPKAESEVSSSPPVMKRREGELVHVVGFWRRAAAAIVDLAIILPATFLVTLLASKLSGVHMPPSNVHLFDIDIWIDLVLATDPAIVMGLVLFVAIGLAYLLVFQIALGKTLGMRVLRIKIIDVYGEKPSPAICIARCGGYLASVATLFLGFLWVGFDSEKRGLQDWIAGTYVVRA